MAPRIPLQSTATISIGLRDTSELATPELSEALSRFAAAVQATELVDPVTSELLRLRNANIQQCRICLGLRSAAALAAGADEALLSAAGDADAAVFSPQQRLVLQLADSYLKGRGAIDESLVAELLDVFEPAQVVMMALKLSQSAMNRVLIALGLDLDESIRQVY